MIFMAAVAAMVCGGTAEASAKVYDRDTAVAEAVEYAEDEEEITEQDVEELKKKAEQGDADAQYNLGLCYETGEVVERDYKEAVKWYKMAAEQGHADAQFNLGFCYANVKELGLGLAEAMEWYEKAAEQGHVLARYTLALSYYPGGGPGQGEHSIPVPEGFEWIKSPMPVDVDFYKYVFVKYKQKVGGYEVTAVCASNWQYGACAYVRGDETYVSGPAYVHFEDSTGNRFVVWSPTIRIPVEEGLEIEDGMLFETDYNQAMIDGYGNDSNVVSLWDPSVDFFFFDIDFDGEKELIMPYHGGLGYKCNDTYEIYEVPEAINDYVFVDNLIPGSSNMILRPEKCHAYELLSSYSSIDTVNKTITTPSGGFGSGSEVPCMMVKFGLVPDYEVDYGRNGWHDSYDHFMYETKRLGLMEVSLCTKEEDVEFRYKLKGDKWSKYVEVKVKDGVYRWQREAVAEDSVANGGEDEEPDMPTIEEAAEQGDVMAQYVLGVCYWNGIEKERDSEEAVKWFEKAAEQGYIDSSTAFRLGNYYYGGDYYFYFSREPNYEKAVKWYKIAAGFTTSVIDEEFVEARLEEANKMLKKQSKGKGKR